MEEVRGTGTNGRGRLGEEQKGKGDNPFPSYTHIWFSPEPRGYFTIYATLLKGQQHEKAGICMGKRYPAGEHEGAGSNMKDIRKERIQGE